MVFHVYHWHPNANPAQPHELNGEDTAASLRYGLLVSSGEAFNAEYAKRVLVFWPGLGGSVKNALGFFNRLLTVVDAVVVPDLAGFGLNVEMALPSVDTHVAQARQFAGWVQDFFPYATFVAGGISLGALIQARALHLHGIGKERWLGQCWVAPAFSPHPETFGLSYQLTALWQKCVGQSVALPYGLEALTRNPQVLADARQQEHCESFRVPMSYLWGIRSLSHQTRQQLNSSRDVLPTMVQIPGQDVVCCPAVMENVGYRLPHPKRHTVRVWPEMFHDMFLEPEMPRLAADVSAWMQSLYNANETVF